MSYGKDWRPWRPEQSSTRAAPRPAQLRVSPIPYDPPFGSHGAMLPSPPPEEQPEPPVPFTIPAPPWQAELESGNLDLAAALAPAAPRIPPTVGEYDPPAPPGSPVVLEPMRYEPPPPPDWEQEARERAELERAERERASREQRAELLREILEQEEQGHTQYPAGRKR